MKMWFCQKSNFLFSLKLLSNVKVACRSVGEMEERVRGKCAAFKIRRGCIFTGMVNKNYIFFSFFGCAFLRSIGDKIGKVSLGAGWVDRSIFGWFYEHSQDREQDRCSSICWLHILHFLHSIHTSLPGFYILCQHLTTTVKMDIQIQTLLSTFHF